MMKFVEVDCSKLEKVESTARSSLNHCNRPVDHLLPIISLYVPPDTKYDKFGKNMQIAQPHDYNGPAEIKSLEEFMKDKCPFYAKRLWSLVEIEKFLEEDLIPSKALFFLDHPIKVPRNINGLPDIGVGVPLEIKALAAEYLGFLDIAIIDESMDEIVERYNITKFPSAVFLKKNATTGKYGEAYHYKGKWDYKN